MHNGACFVDDSRVFRKAYCGAVNSVGRMITLLPADKRALFTDCRPGSPGPLWSEFSAYLKPILDIERLDRDDVFKKSNKFDRPDFGNQIPFELFSAFTAPYLQKQEADKDDDNGFKGDDAEDADQGDDADEAAGETTEDTETHHQEQTHSQSALPTEYDLRIQASKSPEDQATEPRHEHEPTQEKQSTLPEPDAELKKEEAPVEISEKPAEDQSEKPQPEAPEPTQG